MIARVTGTDVYEYPSLLKVKTSEGASEGQIAGDLALLVNSIGKPLG